jgi:hypothetical protein
MVGADGTTYYAVFQADAQGAGTGMLTTRGYGPEGATRWETSHAGPMAAMPDGDVLLMDQSRLYDLHPGGAVAWSVDIPYTLGGGPIVVKGAIYITTLCFSHGHDCEPGITALSWTGDTLWSVGGITPLWMVPGKETIYALSVDLSSMQLSVVAIAD